MKDEEKKMLRLLIRQQELDRRRRKVYRQIIRPLKSKSPLSEYRIRKNDNESKEEVERRRAIFILHRCGFGVRKLGRLFNKDKNTIHADILRIYRNNPTLY